MMRALKFALAFLPILANAQLPPPVVNSITPRSGPTAGGTTVTVEGENLHAPEVCITPGFPCFPPRNAISIGFYQLRMIETSPSRLVGVTTPRPAGTYDVEIRRADGAGVVLPNAFTFGAGEGVERILIPITIPNETSGGFGSRWKSDLLVYNAGAKVHLWQQHPPSCRFDPCPGIVPPGVTERLDLPPRLLGGGALLHIDQTEEPPPGEVDLHFNLRIRDVSREHQTWGTEIPVVRQKAIFVGFRDVNFLNVPFDSRFRVTLRIYDFDGENGQHYGGVHGIPMLVEVFPMSTNERLGFLQVELSKSAELPDFPPVPGYAQVDLTTAFPALVGQGPFRIVVRPTSVWLRWWAFITVTNNETQHVTTITPQ